MHNWTPPFRTTVSVLALLIVMSSPVRAQAPVFVNGWGSFGTGDTQFKTPVGIDFDSADNVYTCDTNNLRVQKFTHSGQYITQWPVGNPYGLAVDQNDNVFVAGPGVVTKFTSSGLLVTQFAQGFFTRGVAIGPTGDVFLVGDNMVRRFNNDGVFLLAWGGTGSADGLFNTADGIAIDPSGHVYVVDYDGRIQRFTSNGVFLGKWGSIGTAPGQFQLPVRLAIDANYNVYVSDHVACRVNKFLTDGTFITRWGSPGSGVGQFNNPIGVGTDSQGNIFVCDTNNSRIQEFAFPTGTLATSSWGSVKSRYRGVR